MQDCLLRLPCRVFTPTSAGSYIHLTTFEFQFAGYGLRPPPRYRGDFRAFSLSPKPRPAQVNLCKRQRSSLQQTTAATRGYNWYYFMSALFS
eukprot:1186437-Prorocentrum_minimum.AAC.10